MLSAVVGGVPAKIIRRRYDDDTIDRLQNVHWWDWDEEKIRLNIDALINGQLDKLKG